MFKLIRLKKAIPFMRLGPYIGVLACVCVAIAIGLLCVKGLTFGLDFTGGTVIELGFEVDASCRGHQDPRRRRH